MENPYSPPLANVERPLAGNAEVIARLEKVRTGQRLVIWAMLLYFSLGALSLLPLSLSSMRLLLLPAMVAVLVMIVQSFVGLFRIWSGLGMPMAFRIILGVLLFVPLIGLLILATSSARATKHLRQHGYRVGLLGAGPLPQSATI